MYSIQANQLTKKFGDFTAVDHICFEVREGEIFGFLGANGAGKTTLMRMLSGLLTPTSGEISYDDMSVKSEDYRNVLGYLPQDFGYYPEFTGREFLMYFCALKGLDKKSAKARCAELLEIVGLEEAADKKIRKYSGGMKQRVGIAQAIINRPEVLILDEPTAGLDPKERVRFRDLIGELGKESVVLLSTHIVSDIEHVADRLIMMKDGQICWQGVWKESDGSLEEFYLKQYE